MQEPMIDVFGVDTHFQCDTMNEATGMRYQLAHSDEQSLLIPRSWTTFQYRGYRYGRDQTGRWIVTAKVEV